MGAAGRVVVVSGGGIGRAVAERFARQGDRVTVLGRRAEVLEAAAREIGGAHPVRAVAGDLALPEARYITGEFLHSNGGAVLGR
ncbi:MULTISPECIES: SDR family NAD(P)-dependent oxidoreductase [Streptomyces]|uniref:SDR family NAD(P)-dependent oxidoreductase n=1 Tax=Streptomyces siderophoricus TaxID=2802281 RepID=A0ABS1MJB0_9ACTN|nr:SDR family NAD(P)-dependent oxidoreductase [Streptomyces sp. 9-7]MBL1088166.1 SDR family NAD(P)-dependent oxidoreductase [Streptomyces sp. 9-7]